PQPQAVAVSAHAQAPARSAPQQPVRRTAHVTSSSRAQPSRPVRAEQVHSPQFSSDAQIAAVLQQRTQAPTGDAHAGPAPHAAGTWVIGKDGSLQVHTSTGADAAIAHATPARSRSTAVPAVPAGTPAIREVPSSGLAQVSATHGAIERSRVARVDATPSLPPVPAMTSSQPLAGLVPSDGVLMSARADVAQVGLTHGVGQVHVQATPSLPPIDH